MKLISIDIKILTNIGINIKNFREKNSISLERFSEMSNTQIRRLRKIEKGNCTNLTLIECQKVSFVLKISLCKLIE